MAPGQGAARLARADAGFGTDAAFVQGFQPGREVKAFHPAAKNRSLVIGFLHHVGHAAVRTGQHAFQMTHGRFMPAQFQAFLALEQFAHQMNPTADLLPADLGFPLEGREGLGHKGRQGGRDLQAGSAAPGGVAHLAAEIGNGGQVFVRFRGQADHKVKLDQPPAVFQQFLGVQQQSLFADALVDDVAQALAARFRSQGAAGAPQIGHAFDDLVVDGAHAQRR